MKRTTFLFIIMITTSLMLLYCKEKQDPLKISTHPDGWGERTSANFHGSMVLQNEVSGYENCRSCHGENLQGGTAGVSCYNSDCHSSYPHPADWTNPASAAFHGKTVLDSAAGLAACTSCHGEDHQGGNTGVSCYQSGCHLVFPHPDGFAEEESENFHAVKIAQDFYWDIVSCRECHGTDYTGKGYEQKNCTKCHTAPGGPEACNTCHGSGVNDAPPPDLAGHTLTTFTGVGAHQVHVADTLLSTAFERDCIQCHIKPQDYDDPGHVDNAPPPADIHFSLFASDSGNTNPQWNHASATCSNVYCHGSFTFRKDESANSWIYTDSLIVGNNVSVVWTNVGGDSTQAACGTCHDLPPKGHMNNPNCSSCHPRVVDADRNIIGKDLHINGQADVF